ncbi:MAG TPA: hypothetical protein PLM75_09500, partial [bacterium]|nr:hypothetical protein [bacterium]
MLVVVIIACFFFLLLRLTALRFPLTSDAGVYNIRGKLFKDNIKSYWVVQIYVVFLYYIKNIFFDNLNVKIKEPYKEFIFRLLCDILFIILSAILLFKITGYYSLFGLIILILFSAAPKNPWYCPFSDFFEFTLFVLLYLFLIKWCECSADKKYIFLISIGCVSLLIFYCKWIFSLLTISPAFAYIILQSEKIIFDIGYILLGAGITFLVIYICAALHKTLPMILYTLDFKNIFKCLVKQRTEEYGLYKGKGKICKEKVNLFQSLKKEIINNFELYVPIALFTTYFPFKYNLPIVITVYLIIALTFICSFLSLFLYGRRIFFIGIVAFIYSNNFFAVFQNDFSNLHKYMILGISIVLLLSYIFKNLNFFKADSVLEKYIAYYPSASAIYSYNAHKIGDYLNSNLKIGERFYIHFFQWFTHTVAHIAERETIAFENTYDINFQFMSIFNDNEWGKKIIDDINEKKIEIILIHIKDEPIIFKYLKYKYEFIKEEYYFRFYRRKEIFNFNCIDFDYKRGDSLYSFKFENLDAIRKHYYSDIEAYTWIVGNILNQIKKDGKKAIYCNNVRTVNFLKLLYEINNIKIDYIIDRKIENIDEMKLLYKLKFIID